MEGAPVERKDKDKLFLSAQWRIVKTLPLISSWHVSISLIIVIYNQIKLAPLMWLHVKCQVHLTLFADANTVLFVGHFTIIAFPSHALWQYMSTHFCPCQNGQTNRKDGGAFHGQIGAWIIWTLKPTESDWFSIMKCETFPIPAERVENQIHFTASWFFSRIPFASVCYVDWSDEFTHVINALLNEVFNKQFQGYD